jgi:hypothetical protein
MDDLGRKLAEPTQRVEEGARQQDDKNINQSTHTVTSTFETETSRDTKNPKTTFGSLLPDKVLLSGGETSNQYSTKRRVKERAHTLSPKRSQKPRKLMDCGVARDCGATSIV